MSEINSLIFNDIEVENDFRWLLSNLFSEEQFYTLFGSEINFVKMDYVEGKKVDLPAVMINIEQNDFRNKDDTEIQRYTGFRVTIDVYTSGKNKILKNKTLCNEIIKIMQSNGQLPHYYCRGLSFDSNREVASFVDDCYRRVIVMSGLCDNKQKLIKGD